MKASIIAIGNSRGLRLPKAVIEHFKIKDEVELDIKKDNIVIWPLNKTPRLGWGEVFKRMHDTGGDKLILGEFPEVHDKDWIW